MPRAQVGIEKALAHAPGVRRASVNFATGRATVEYDPLHTGPVPMRDVVRSVGYDAIVAEPRPSGRVGDTHADDLADAETQAREADYRRQRTKFWIAASLTLPVAFLSIGAHLLPQLAPLLDQPWRPWAELALTTPVLFWAGRDFFSGAWKAARHRAADMNTLVAIGTLSAYVYSLVATVAPELFIQSLADGTHEHSATSQHAVSPTGVYYEVAAIIVTLILMGRLLEARAAQQDQRRHSRT